MYKYDFVISLTKKNNKIIFAKEDAQRINVWSIKKIVSKNIIFECTEKQL